MYVAIYMTITLHYRMHICHTYIGIYMHTLPQLHE